jgi:rhodanese-related sulfurtransferase
LARPLQTAELFLSKNVVNNRHVDIFRKGLIISLTHHKAIQEPAMSLSSITPKQLHDAVEADPNLELIDVRTPAEYDAVHIGFARNVPLSQLDPARLAATRSGDERPLYVVCRSGSRGRQACEQLLAAGHRNVFNVEGGTMAWDRAGLPVVRGRSTISLERQVPIASGSLILLSTALGFFVHPYWFSLAALVGAGLVLSGVTDSCAMAAMLARMPWNRAKPARPAMAPAASGGEKAKTCCSGH